MRIEQETLEPFEVSYPVELLADPEKLLFLDIETTGFTARSSYLYLIGCAYFSGGHWRTIQWFAETYEQEKDILEAFFAFRKDYTHLVHFNGNQFDLTFIRQKCQDLHLYYDLDQMTGIDLYKRISPLKQFLKLPNCKQKTMETFLGIDRKDAFSGGELIGIYHDYVQNPSEFSRNSLLLHNEDDLRGMLQILPMLTYYDMMNGELRVRKVQANSYRDYNGLPKQEVVMQLGLPTCLPKPVSVFACGCFFHGEGQDGQLKVPLFTEEMKYFYANFKEYYYLPEEDVALHKSVATFVAPDHRTQATAATCYTRKMSSYLPQWEVLFEPIFRREYHSRELFFELTDEMKRDRNAFTAYAKHVLSVIASHY
ncbi:MAG: ribonuclease H-like domain-containing protein [Lachnospiraceae bacterium]|nr:ribonuclease H-like domain-containing protein [Lachnospiraceae bacterium]